MNHWESPSDSYSLPPPLSGFELSTYISLKEVSGDIYSALSTGGYIVVEHSDNKDYSLSDKVRSVIQEDRIVRTSRRQYIYLVTSNKPVPGSFMQCTFVTITPSVTATSSEDDNSMRVIVKCENRWVGNLTGTSTKILAKANRKTRNTHCEEDEQVMLVVDVYAPSLIHGGFDHMARLTSNTFKVMSKVK